MTDILTVIQGILDQIPVVISSIRDNVGRFIPSQYYTIIIAILASVAAFYWVRQFISSGFLKLKVILNILLLALLIFTILMYVR